MPKYLSQEWLDLQRELAQDLPERPGANGRVQYVVTGAPGGDVRYATVVADGRLAEATLGVDPDAQVTLTATYADAVQILRGELDASTAFMQGRMKVTGDMGVLLSLMPLSQSPEHAAVQERLAGRTEV